MIYTASKRRLILLGACTCQVAAQSANELVKVLYLAAFTLRLAQKTRTLRQAQGTDIPQVSEGFVFGGFYAVLGLFVV